MISGFWIFASNFSLPSMSDYDDDDDGFVRAGWPVHIPQRLFGLHTPTQKCFSCFQIY